MRKSHGQNIGIARALKRFLAGFLSFVMIMSYLPSTAYAQEEGNGADTPAVEETVNVPEENVQEEGDGTNEPAVGQVENAPEESGQEEAQVEEPTQSEDQELQLVETQPREAQQYNSNKPSKYKLNLLDQNKLQTSHWYYQALGYGIREESPEELASYDVTGGARRGNLILGNDWNIAQGAKEIRFLVRLWYPDSSVSEIDAWIGNNDAVCRIIDHGVDGNGYCWYYCSVKYEDVTKVIDGDVTCAIHINPANIVYEDYKFEYGVTENGTVVINKISKANDDASGTIVIPATIDGLPVSGFAGGLFDEVKDTTYTIVNETQNGTGVILPVFDRNKFIWVNEDRTQKLTLLKNGTARRQEKYNYSIDFETLDLGAGDEPEVPELKIAEVDSVNGERLDRAETYSNPGVFQVTNWLHDEELYGAGTTAGINIYLEKKYAYLLRELKVKSYKNYPSRNMFADTSTWEELDPVVTETDGLVKYAYAFGEDAEKYNNGTYGLGIEVKYGTAPTVTTSSDPEEAHYSIDYLVGTVTDSAGERYISGDASSITINVETEKSHAEDAEIYGIRSVSATIGGKTAYVAKADGKEALPDGQYIIKKSENSDEPIDEDVVITVGTKRIHFVDFVTVPNQTEIGCVPDGGDFIPTDPWEGGVYVFDGKTLSFHLIANAGYAITKVTEGEGEGSEELEAVGDEINTAERYQTGTYTTRPIEGRTSIIVSSVQENDPHFVTWSGDLDHCIYSISDGADDFSGRIDQNASSITVNVKTQRSKNSEENFGIENVTAKIGEVEAYVEKVVPKNPNAPIPDGEYVIRTSKDNPAPITGDVVVKVDTKPVIFVGFTTRENDTGEVGESIHHVGIEPVGGEGSDFIGTVPWEGGVYVFKGKTLKFRFNVDHGYRVLDVHQGGGRLEEDLLQPDDENYNWTGQSAQSGVYTTKAINTKTYIYTYAKKVENNKNVIKWNRNKKKYNVSIAAGADPITGEIDNNATSVKIEVRPVEPFGIENVTAKIGDRDATAEAGADNIYTITAGDGEVIDGDVNVTIDTGISFQLQPTDGVTITPKKGLVSIAGSDTDYTYSGDGDIQFQINGIDLTKTVYQDDWQKQYMLSLAVGGDNPPFRFMIEPIEDDPATPEVEEGGLVTIPAHDEYAEPEAAKDLIDFIMMLADEAYDKNGGIIPVSVDFVECRPAKQLILLNADQIDYDFKYDPSLIKVGGRIYFTEDAAGKRFKFNAKAKDGVSLESITTNTIRFFIEDDNVQYEPATGYPGTQKLDLSVNPNELYPYTFELPENREWDDESILGIELEAKTKQLATVSVAVSEGATVSDGNAALDQRLFDVGFRVDSRTYPATYDDGVVTAQIPLNSKVTVSVTSRDGLWAVSEAVPTDNSKNTGKKQKASKTGEYTLQIHESTTANLELAAVKAAKVIVTDADDNVLEPVKNAYTLKAADIFTAYVAEGSVYNDQDTPELEDDVMDPIVVDSTFSNGKKAIAEGEGITITPQKLTTSGSALKLKKLSLSAKAGTKSYSTTINFVTPPTITITSPKPKQGEIVLTYGKKETIKLTMSGDTKGVSAWVCELTDYDYETNTPTFGQIENIANMGSFDGKTITIDPKKAVKYPRAYKPNGGYELCFYDAQGNKIGEKFDNVYSLTISPAPAIHDKAAPVIKANDSLSTNRAIGLTLSLPKGVKAVDGMYYRIVAHADSFAGLSYNRDRFDDEGQYLGPEEIHVFMPEVIAYVPANETKWALDVSDSPMDVEDGWRIDYDISASVVYAVPSNPNDVTVADKFDDTDYWILKFDGNFQQTATSATQTFHTKENTFETKLTLTKKLPAKVYNGQKAIPVAIPKWSKTTSVQGLDCVRLLNEYGNERGRWDRSNGTNTWDYDITVDPETGLVSMDTANDWENTWMEDGLTIHEYGTDYLEPGKYTVEFYAIGGPGQQAKTTLSVTVSESIHSLSVSAPSSVMKTYNKAATVKADVAYNVNEWEKAPATKKVDWSLVQIKTPAVGVIPATYQEIPDDSPLYNNLTIKNGTVTVNAKMLVDLAKYSEEDYTFVIKATAADWAGNTTTGYSEPIRITSEAQIPTEIQFVWDQYEYDPVKDEEVFIGWDYSAITESEIARRAQAQKMNDIYMEPFYSNSIQYSKVRVLDQYGAQMNATLKLTGVKQNEEGRLIISKAGKVSVTATALDGGKKSKKIEFTIANGDARFTPNVLIQQESQFYGDRDKAFINTDNRWETVGGKDCTNSAPANKYLYVHVAAARYADIGEENGAPRLFKWSEWGDEPDYGDVVMFSHSVSVKGGAIKATLDGQMDKYKTYVILPTAAETVVTVTDNTVDSRFARSKTSESYTISNSQISNQAARKITANKSSIANWMWTKWDGYANSVSNPNFVTYSIDKYETEPGRNYYVKISMDELSTDAMHNLAKAFYMPDNDEEYAAFVAEVDAFANSQDPDYHNRLAVINARDDIDDVEKDRMIWRVREPFARDQENMYFDAFREQGVMRPVSDGEFSIGFFAPGIDYDNGGTICDFSETPAGTYNFYVTYGYEDAGQFIPLQQPVKMSVKLAAATAPTVKFATTSYKLAKNDDNDFVAQITTPEVKNGLGISQYYDTISTNTGGVSNAFRDLFYVDNDGFDGNQIMSGNQVGVLKVNNEIHTDIPVGSGKNLRYAHINDWWDLAQLRDGTLVEWAGGGFNPCYESVGTPADQKKAYTTWIKANTTGFLRCDSVGYDGRYRTVDTKITVDIDEYVKNQGPTVTFATTAYKLSKNADDEFVSLIATPTVINGQGIEQYYQTFNMRSNDTVNVFGELFWADNEGFAEHTLMPNDLTGVLKVNNIGNVDNGEGVWIQIGSGKATRYAHIRSWWELYQLKLGQFTAQNGDGEWHENGVLVGTKKNQQTAYKSWVAANCTGYLRCNCIRLDDSTRESYTKITVNIEDFVDSQKDQALNP